MMLQRSNGEEVHSSPTSRKQKSSCTCCPYGYHIDLDFVRYCEVFNNAAHPSPASKLRERRRQRQSMEVLLGLTSPTVWQIEQQLPQVPQEVEEMCAPAPINFTDSNSSAAQFRDALHKAVLDFEETLQRSKRRPSAPDVADTFEDKGTLLLYDCGGPLRRSLSASSLASSLSEGSVALAPTARFLQAGSGAALMTHDSDVASIGSAASGVSTGALQNIREQMAKSLEKMREMEERVKIIPMLQGQLAALKEEKRLMQLQLKSGEAERNKLISVEAEAADLRQRVENLSNRGIATPRLQRKYLQTFEAHETTNDENYSNKTEESMSTDVEKSSEVENLIKKCSTRDVGVECSVLTRDVGVTHLSPKLYNKSTQSNVSPMNLSLSGYRSESILPTLSSHLTDSNKNQEEKIISPPPPPLPVVIKTDNSTNTTGVDVKHVSSSTDIRMNQVFTEKEMENILSEHEKKILKDEETSRSRRRVDKGVLAKPRVSDFSMCASPRMRDSASSDCTINDINCDKCNVKKKSIGVGSAGFLRIPSDQDPISITAMTRSKSSDSFNLRSRLRAVSFKCVDTRDLHTYRDTGVNTIKKKLVDIGVGHKILTRDECVETNHEELQQKECQKCLANSTLSSLSPQTPSRIPRLAKTTTTTTTTPSTQSPSSSQNGKKPFMRQDTYTKIIVEDTNNDESELPSIHVEEVRVTPAESKSDLAVSKRDPESRLSGASGSLESEEEDDDYLERDDYHQGPLYSHGVAGGALSHKKTRKKAEPSREMRGAMKVLNDSLKKSPRSEVPTHVKNAVNIIQQEWFKISSTATANPLDVEDYLDCFEEISGVLIEHIVNMSDNSGNTAMHYAVSHGNFDVVSILLDSKVCDINQANQAGYTSVMLVSLAQMRSETDSQVVQRLFQLADVNVRAKQHGQTALMLASSHGRLGMANMLLAAGADVNIQDEDGSTALMCAAEHGHVEMVRLLLAQPDCDAGTTDHDGSTALNIAMEAGHRDVGVLLYAHQHFSSRGSSPYSSLKSRRPKS